MAVMYEADRVAFEHRFEVGRRAIFESRSTPSACN
jgi:hypothetical protein